MKKISKAYAGSHFIKSITFTPTGASNMRRFLSLFEVLQCGNILDSVVHLRFMPTAILLQAPGFTPENLPDRGFYA